MKGHIEKRGEKSWRVRIYLGRDEQGEHRYLYRTVVGTKKDAQKTLTELLNEAHNNSLVIPQKMTVAEFMERWLRDYAEPNLAPTSLRYYTQAVRSHIVPQLGRIDLIKLTPMQLQGYYSRLLREGRLDYKGDRTGKGLSSTTVLKHHRIIHEALSHAMKWGLVSRNIAEMVEPPRKANPKLKTWSPVEVRQFLNTITDHRHYAFFLTALMTGMRLGELLGLRWVDVDLNENKLSVQQTLTKGGEAPSFGHAKTDRSRRTIALPQSVVTTMRRLRAIQNQERLILGSDYIDSGLVFTRESGKHIDPTWVSRKLFHRLCKEAHVPQIRFHDLRHTHATLMLSEGVNPKIVSERLGHAGVQITLDTYSHVLPDMQKQAADTVETAIFQSAISHK